MIHVFIGTKAQLIKMAPVMRKLKERGVRYNFIHSGQHQETISDIIKDFDIPNPDSYIVNGPDIKVKTQVPKWMYYCEKRTRKLSSCWQGRRKGDNDIILVHGDTLSTLIGALAAKRMGFKCGHVESGLRSFNLFHPFPEEFIRLATGRLADILYCPDEVALKNVSSMRKKTISTFGNTMLDSTRLAAQSVRHVQLKEFGIVSIHRYENIFSSQRLSWIVQRIIDASKCHKIIFIMHPPTEQRLKDTGLYGKLDAEPNIELRKRLSYFDFTGLLSRASFLVTDGGSNQEESSYLGLPCLVMRKGTERKEGLGRNVVISYYSEQVVKDFFKNFRHYKCPGQLSRMSPSEIIVDDLAPFY